MLRARPEAPATINDQPAHEGLLRNGDLIGVGPLKLQFWLAETRQPGLRLGETLTWTGIVLVAMAQVALIWWLLR